MKNYILGILFASLVCLQLVVSDIVWDESKSIPDYIAAFVLAPALIIIEDSSYLTSHIEGKI